MNLRSNVVNAGNRSQDKPRHSSGTCSPWTIRIRSSRKRCSARNERPPRASESEYGSGKNGTLKPPHAVVTVCQVHGPLRRWPEVDQEPGPDPGSEPEAFVGNSGRFNAAHRGAAAFLRLSIASRIVLNRSSTY